MYILLVLLTEYVSTSIYLKQHMQIKLFQNVSRCTLHILLLT